MEQVSQESIEKAKQILGLIKAEEKKEPVVEPKKEEQVDLNKGKNIDTLKAEYADAVSKAKEYSEKANALKAEIGAMGDPMGNDSEILASKKGEELDIQKAIKESNDSLIKAFDDKLTAVTTLLTAKEQENTELKKSIETLSARVEDIAKQPVKSGTMITKAAVERFAPNSQEGERVMSIKNNRRQLTAELVKAAHLGEANENKLFAKAASNMEISGAPASVEEIDDFARILRKELKIVLTA